MALTEFEDIYPVEAELVENREQNVCLECDRQFSNKGALRMHTVKTHRQLDKPTDISLQSRTQRTVQKTTKRFHCPKSECNKVYENLRNLAQHFQKVHCEKTHECGGCGNKFALERDLRYHIKQRCFKTRSNSTTEKKAAKPQKRSKKTAQSTQTDCVVIKLVIAPRVTKTTIHTQTEDPMPDYQMNANYSTSDFAGQYDHATYNDYAQSVATFDQSTTMYDNFASTSTYISQTPEMVDVATYAAADSQNYFMDPNNYLTQTTQTYINPDCSQWRDYDYRSTQTNSSTQTNQSLQSWFGKSHESVSRDIGSMTDHFR